MGRHRLMFGDERIAKHCHSLMRSRNPRRRDNNLSIAPGRHKTSPPQNKMASGAIRASGAFVASSPYDRAFAHCARGVKGSLCTRDKGMRPSMGVLV
jgi:hypothetical protein